MSSSSDHENFSGSESNEGSTVHSKPSNFLQKSEELAALQQVEFENLPAPVKRRVNALKNLQLKVTNLEARFYQEVHLLECKYNTFYYPIHEKRQHIITGIYEPRDEEAEWKLDSEVDESISKELEDKAKVADTSKKVTDKAGSKKTILGIPMFWLTALKNVPMVAEMIQPHDEPILSNLIDIKTIILESDPMGFVLEFHFLPNEYFTNSVLTKEYEMKCMPDPCDPFTFEGPEIVTCKGCKIDWNKGKNVTVKQVKKKQKHKNRSAVTRTVVKTVQNDSFFHFFSPPNIPEDSDSEEYDEMQALLTSDFEIGHFIRERIVPNAVLYFTGEAIDEDFEDDEEEEDDEEDDEAEDEEESDLDDNKDTPPAKSSRKKGRSGHTNNASAKEALAAGKNSNAAECKQQ